MSLILYQQIANKLKSKIKSTNLIGTLISFHVPAKSLRSQ